MKKKDLQALIKDLRLDEIDLDALKHFEFKRKKKGGPKKWVILALAALGAAVAYQTLKKK